MKQTNKQTKQVTQKGFDIVIKPYGQVAQHI
jgi:hypothetical protein